MSGCLASLDYLRRYDFIIVVMTGEVRPRISVIGSKSHIDSLSCARICLKGFVTSPIWIFNLM